MTAKFEDQRIYVLIPATRYTALDATTQQKMINRTFNLLTKLDSRTIDETECYLFETTRKLALDCSILSEYSFYTKSEIKKLLSL